MVPDRSSVRRRAVLATAGGGLSGLAGCNFGYLGDTSSDQPPLWGESIRIGVLSFQESSVANDILDGAKMAAERINADGGVAGAGIELVEANTAGDPETALAEHRRLCEEENCDLTVGLFVAWEVPDVLESVAEQETVHLTTGTADGRPSRMIADDYGAYRYHFRPGLPNYGHLVDAQLAFVQKHADAYGWERAALLVENLESLVPHVDRLEAGLEDVLDVPIAVRTGGLSSWSPLYDDIEEEDCDVALSWMALGGNVAITRWAMEERAFDFGGLHLRALAHDNWEETEGNVESVFTLAGLTPASGNTGRTRGFVDDFRARFGRSPAYTAATTYDALKLYRLAVESVVQPGDGELPDQETIVEALEGVTYTDGLLYRELEFSGPDAELVHEPVWESMTETGVPVVAQWQADGEGGGSRVAVAPERSRTATYQRPPWIDGGV